MTIKLDYELTNMPKVIEEIKRAPYRGFIISKEH